MLARSIADRAIETTHTSGVDKRESAKPAVGRLLDGAPVAPGIPLAGEPLTARMRRHSQRQGGSRDVTHVARHRQRPGAQHRRRLGRMQPGELAGLRRQAVGRRRQDGHTDRQRVVAERAVGRGRRGRLDQLVHQARGGPARARRGRQGQGLQARPRVQREDAAVRHAPVHHAHPGHADRRSVRRQQDRLARRVRVHRDRSGRHPVRRPRPHRGADRRRTASATRCVSTMATSSRTLRPLPA